MSGSGLLRRTLSQNDIRTTHPVVLSLQRRDRGWCDHFAPFLHEMSGLSEFERLRTTADVAMESAHDRRSKDRIGHADGHDAAPLPFVAPAPGGDGGGSTSGLNDRSIRPPAQWTCSRRRLHGFCLI